MDWIKTEHIYFASRISAVVFFLLSIWALMFATLGYAMVLALLAIFMQIQCMEIRFSEKKE